MATEWKSQQGDGKFAIQFETDNRDLYKLVEKACQIAMDEAELAKFKNALHPETEKMCQITNTPCTECKPGGPCGVKKA